MKPTNKTTAKATSPEHDFRKWHVVIHGLVHLPLGNEVPRAGQQGAPIPAQPSNGIDRLAIVPERPPVLEQGLAKVLQQRHDCVNAFYKKRR